MLLFLKEMLKCMEDGEEILIYLIISHTLCDLKSQGVEQMCEHHRYLLASHGALDSCHSRRRWMPKPLPMPQEELGVWRFVSEVSRGAGSSQGSRLAPVKSPGT